MTLWTVWRSMLSIQKRLEAVAEYLQEAKASNKVVRQGRMEPVSVACRG